MEDWIIHLVALGVAVTAVTAVASVKAAEVLFPLLADTLERAWENIRRERRRRLQAAAVLMSKVVAVVAACYLAAWSLLVMWDILQAFS